MKTVTLTVDISVGVPDDVDVKDLTIEMECEDFNISHKTREVKFEVEGYQITAYHRA